MKKSTLIIKILIILAIVAITLIIYYNINNYLPDNYLYKLTYSDNGIPGNTYEIFIYDDYNIKVSKATYGSTLEYMQGNKKIKVTLENVVFTDENKKLVKEFIDELFENKNTTEIDISLQKFNSKQECILYAIIHNSEEFLKYIDEEKLIGI